MLDICSWVCFFLSSFIFCECACPPPPGPVFSVPGHFLSLTNSAIPTFFKLFWRWDTLVFILCFLLPPLFYIYPLSILFAGEWIGLVWLLAWFGYSLFSSFFFPFYFSSILIMTRGVFCYVLFSPYSLFFYKGFYSSILFFVFLLFSVRFVGFDGFSSPFFF